MDLEEFLNKPKLKRGFKTRVREKVEKLRSQIEVTGEVTDHRSKRCCGKTSYPTEEEAQAALRDVRNGKRKRNKKPVRVYKCEFGNWHLTSAPFKSWMGS